MDVPVMEAYTTKAILGGMTMAMELEVAISAVENGAEKPPCSTIAGISTAPRAQQLQGRNRRWRQEAGYDNTYDGDTAFFVSYAGINEFDQSFGDTGFCHDVS